MPQIRSKNFVRALLILLTFFVYASVPLIFKHDYYYLDDTIRGAVGQWYEIGKLISNGHLPILDIAAQGSGNHLAEGQWGTFSPLTWVIGLVYYNVNNFFVLTTLFKIILLVFSGYGVLRLAKEYGTNDFWAYVAGAAVMTMGFPLYASAPNWVTDLMVSSMLPWFWVSLKRLVEGRSNYLITFFIGFNLISIGYVFGTLYLVLVMFGFLVQAILKKNSKDITTVILAGIPLALFTIAVYIPGILVAHQTMRNTSGIFNNDFLSPTIDSLVGSYLPNYYTNIKSWYSADSTTFMPLMYLSWTLPILLMSDWKQIKIKINWNKYVPVLILLSVSFLLTFGPSDVGPLRFPMRNIVYFGTAVIVLFAVYMSHTKINFKFPNIMATLAWVLAGLYISLSQTPTRYKVLILSSVIVFAGIYLVSQQLAKGQTNKALLAFFSFTVVLLGLQHIKDNVTAPRHTFSMWQGQKTKNEMLGLKFKFSGDSIIYLGERSVEPISPLGNNFYIIDTPTPNIYSPVGFNNFSKHLRGREATYINNWKFIKNMFQEGQGTNIKNYDLLSIDTMQFIKGKDKEFNKYLNRDKTNPPEGWAVTENNDKSLIWQRTTPTPPAELTVSTDDGSPAKITKIGTYKWKIEGTSKKFILSRMNWEGYQVSKNANIIKPVNGYLLTIEKKGTDTEPIILTYSAPGFKISVFSIFLGTTIAIATFIWQIALRMRNKQNGKK